jgi:hypothetical protein
MDRSKSNANAENGAETRTELGVTRHLINKAAIAALSLN